MASTVINAVKQILHSSLVKDKNLVLNVSHCNNSQVKKLWIKDCYVLPSLNKVNWFLIIYFSLILKQFYMHFNLISYVCHSKTTLSETDFVEPVYSFAWIIYC